MSLRELQYVGRWDLYRMFQEEMSIFWEVIVLFILRKKVCMYMCPILNGFWDRAISLNSCKIVDKEIVCIVSYIGIYCSSDKVGTVHLVQYILHFATRVRTWHVACLSASWRSFMLVIISIMRSSNLSCVSTFVLYTSLFIQPHKQKSNGMQYGGNEGQNWAPNPNSLTVK